MLENSPIQSCGQEEDDSPLSQEPFPHVPCTAEVDSGTTAGLQLEAPMPSMAAMKIRKQRSRNLRYLIYISGFIVARAKTLLEGGAEDGVAPVSGFYLVGRIASGEGCKDEKNTVRLSCHASNLLAIRPAWQERVSAN
jgi:hypothetical protein